MLIDDGFVPNACDPCVLNRVSTGIQTTVVIYVDDLLVTCKDRTHIAAVKNLIELHFDEVKVKSGFSVTYLGMNLERIADPEDDRIEVTMKAFTDVILQEWHEANLYHYAVPADDKLLHLSTDYKLLDEPTARKFHKTVAQL